MQKDVGPVIQSLIEQRKAVVVLVPNYREEAGAAKKREGRACEVLPLRKGGGGRKKF